jgi:hypothetical protein
MRLNLLVFFQSSYSLAETLALFSSTEKIVAFQGTYLYNSVTMLLNNGVRSGRTA